MAELKKTCTSTGLAISLRAEKQELYTPDFSASVGGRDSGDFLRQFFRRGAKLDPMSRLGYVDAASFLCCNCLEYADRMSMANSLEVRAPFTDYRLLEFAMQVPQRMKVRNMTTKWITRQAMRDILPREVLTKKKMGFNPPLPQWINGELQAGDTGISLACGNLNAAASSVRTRCRSSCAIMQKIVGTMR